MNVASPPEGILDPQQPYWPANKVGEITWTRLKGKLTGRPIPELSGEQHTSYVKLSSADADRLIANIKKWGKYPQVNQNDKYGGALNNEAYQKWLVEEFLEKPFQQQTNQKIEDAAIESRLREIQEQKKQKVQSFLSGGSTFRSGKKISFKTTKLSGIIPKRTLPKEISEKISTSSSSQSPEIEGGESVSKSLVASLGRLTLNLEQSNNDLETITNIIKDDYKNTREINKKEIEEYRKRIANRGRILGKKELGGDKVDLAGLVKQYVGTFFAGTGGALRGLSALNIIEGIMTGDVGKIFGGLTGITASYIPAIGMAVGGKIAASLGEKLFLGRRAGGALRGFGGVARGARPLMRGGGRVALGAGLLTGGALLGSKIFGGGGEGQKVQDIISPKQGQGGGPDVLMPQDALKRFDELNKKFEQAINRLLAGRPGPGPGPGGTVISSSPGEAKLAAFVATLESSQLQDQSDVLQSMVNRAGQNYGGYGGLFGQLTRPNQYSPLSAAIHGTTDPAAQQLYGPIADKLGRNPQERIANLQTIISQPDGLSQLQSLFGRGNASAAKQLLDDFYSAGPLSTESKRFIQGRTNFGAASGVGGATGSGQIRRSSNTFGGANAAKSPSSLTGLVPAAPILPPPVSPAAAAPRNLPAPGSTSQPNIQPFPVSSAANSPSSAAVDPSEGPPPIDTTYPENFLALYSKLIYQIV